jgi:hypothetical protein
MKHRTRDVRRLRQLLESVAESYGAEIRLEPVKGSHLRATFVLGDRQRFIITGTNERSDCNVRADAHRALRKLTEVCP